jgi:hypothetical protein
MPNTLSTHLAGLPACDLTIPPRPLITYKNAKPAPKRLRIPRPCLLALAVLLVLVISTLLGALVGATAGIILSTVYGFLTAAWVGWEAVIFCAALGAFAGFCGMLVDVLGDWDDFSTYMSRNDSDPGVY